MTRDEDQLVAALLSRISPNMEVELTDELLTSMPRFTIFALHSSATHTTRVWAEKARDL